MNRAPRESSTLKTLLVATLGAFAICGVGAYALDLHGHQCASCGRRWRHFGAFNLGDEESHTCSSCGEVQWWKCGAPHVMRGSQFATLPPPSGVSPPLLSPPAPAPSRALMPECPGALSRARSSSTAVTVAGQEQRR
jgi:hypothetical protein